MNEYLVTLNFSDGTEEEMTRFAYSAESAAKSFELEHRKLYSLSNETKLSSVVAVWTCK